MVNDVKDEQSKFEQQARAALRRGDERLAEELEGCRSDSGQPRRRTGLVPLAAAGSA